MLQAIIQAEKGRYKIGLGALAGAVIVKNGKVIGRGYHEFDGGPHAEATALKIAGKAARKATLYCTLEPCNFYGKTPPCTEAIIEAGISRVVVGTEDLYHLVDGKGIERLRMENVKVQTEVRRRQTMEQNEIFFKTIQSRLPFTVLLGELIFHEGILDVLSPSSNAELNAAFTSRNYAVILSRKRLSDKRLINNLVADGLRKIPILIVAEPCATLEKEEFALLNSYCDKVVLLTRPSDTVALTSSDSFADIIPVNITFEGEPDYFNILSRLFDLRINLVIFCYSAEQEAFLRRQRVIDKVILHTSQSRSLKLKALMKLVKLRFQVNKVKILEEHVANRP